LLAASEGAVRLESASEAPLAECVHYLGHEDAVKGALAVHANLAFWRAVLGETGLGVGEALEAVGLGGLARLRAGVLSAGQKRRL
ncbi:hypothetical protein NL425_27070, partial [Klebsiella pneumoniae]|nr:hypothetical protein [Klebsiella pneumoniae]